MKQSVIGSRHLLLHFPDDWTNDLKGDFFDRFVADLLKPMRYEVRQRLRVTGDGD